MAAEAIALPPRFIADILASLRAIRDIRETIVNTRASVENLSLEACQEINLGMLMQIRIPMRDLNAPVVNFRRQGGRVGIPNEIQGQIGRILGSYSTVEIQLGRLAENHDITTTREIYDIYAESLHLLTDMETQMLDFYIHVTGQDSIGGYRKRTQRTQHKRKTHRKSKTHRKRKTHYKRK